MGDNSHPAIINSNLYSKISGVATSQFCRNLNPLNQFSQSQPMI